MFCGWPGHLPLGSRGRIRHRWTWRGPNVSSCDGSIPTHSWKIYRRWYSLRGVAAHGSRVCDDVLQTRMCTPSHTSHTVSSFWNGSDKKWTMVSIFQYIVTYILCLCVFSCKQWRAAVSGNEITRQNIPAGTIIRSSADLMLVHRLRRWPNIK